MDWGKIKMPEIPVQNYASEDLQKSTPINVLVQATFVGSGKKVLEGLAYDLSKTKWGSTGVNMFNVTVLTSKDTKYLKKQTDNFNLVQMTDFDSEVLNKNINPFTVKTHDNYLVEKFVRENDKELVEKLRSVKFENVIHYIIPFDYYIA